MAFVKRIQFHRCFAPDCQKDVPSNKLMCFAHWKMVPAAIQDQIIAAWKDGLKFHHHPTEAYLVAVREAQAHIRTIMEARLAKANKRNFVLGMQG